MAQIINSLTNAIAYINTLMELDSDPPTSGDEDYTVWTNLINVAVNLWEKEEGVLWKELFVDLTDAATGDKTTVANDYSYTLPTDFKFPNSAYVWLGSGTNKTTLQVIKIEDKQLYENNSEEWCYFTPTALKINPNLTITAGYTISYSYYKWASALTTGTDTLEMSDPMFAVYYTVAQLSREEGNAEYLNIATQKLESMKTRNESTALYQKNAVTDPTGDGFGY